MKKHMQPKFTLIWKDDSNKKRSYHLTNKTWIGRSSGFGLPSLDPYLVILKPEKGSPVPTGIYDSTVSRRHSLLEIANDGILVKDIGTRGEGSANGTYINESRVSPSSPMLARPGDTIRVGLYTTFKVGLLERDKSVELVKPGDVVIVDSTKLVNLPKELIRKSVKLDINSYLVYIPHDAALSKNSFEAQEGVKVRIDTSISNSLEVERRILQNILFYIKDIQLDLGKDPPRGTEAATKLKALLSVEEYRKELEKITSANKEIVANIATIVDLILKGKSSQAQVKRLVIEVNMLAEMVDLKLKSIPMGGM